jgi:predicted DNA-binding protein YlxM (UPF0122 family)
VSRGAGQPSPASRRDVQAVPADSRQADQERWRRALLWDYYGALLTDRQQTAWRLHFLEDWSLAEVASWAGVSRAAVQDQLNRAQAAMEAYEATLGLLAAHRQRRERLRQLQQLAAAERWQALVAAIRQWAREEGLDDV